MVNHHEQPPFGTYLFILFPGILSKSKFKVIVCGLPKNNPGSQWVNNLMIRSFDVFFGETCEPWLSAVAMFRQGPSDCLL